MASIFENPNPVVVAFYFKPSDAPKLWELARRHCLDSEDMTWFAAAARAAERGTAAVIEASTKGQIEEAVAFFVRHGIEPPEVDAMRVD